MYTPKHFKQEDKTEIAKLVREYPFATLVTVNAGSPLATHIPLELVIDTTGDWLLHGHIARANPQWKTLESSEVLAIFTGPHTYVSPSWYNHRNVPTWNYQAVHLYGKATLVEGERLEVMLQQLMKRYEDAHAEKPQDYYEIPEHTLQTDLRGVVGFEINIGRIEATSKLSQNRDAESYQSVIDHLKNMDAYDAKRISEEMEAKRK
ncbi:MAG TPA: FMN-binding negative transcriptional regulator [Chitinophagales bacterium]|nr:FMN-binding negative transcriptional regulator [Chitinophagales bacterium]